MNAEHKTIREFLHKRKRFLFVLIGIAVLCPIMCLVLWLLSTSVPSYVELNIPDIGLTDTVRSTFTWGDTGQNHFIWRQQIFVTHEGFDSWDSIVKYYDGYLTAQGWKRYDNKGFTPCNAYMPETEFLQLGQNGYIYYRRPESKDYHSGATVCLAVFNAGSSKYFNVVLQTINPSPLAAFAEDVD